LKYYLGLNVLVGYEPNKENTQAERNLADFVGREMW